MASFFLREEKRERGIEEKGIERRQPVEQFSGGRDGHPARRR